MSGSLGCGQRCGPGAWRAGNRSRSELAHEATEEHPPRGCTQGPEGPCDELLVKKAEPETGASGRNRLPVLTLWRRLGVGKAASRGAAQGPSSIWRAGPVTGEGTCQRPQSRTPAPAQAASQNRRFSKVGVPRTRPGCLWTLMPPGPFSRGCDQGVGGVLVIMMPESQGPL